MKKVLLTLLAVIVIVGALAGAGYAGYRIGYGQGATASDNPPFFDRSERMGPNFMPMPNFGREFGPAGSDLFYRDPMMRRSLYGIYFFSPLRILWNLAIFALIVWFVVWLFTRSGWRIVRQSSTAPTTPPDGSEG